jgi:hypothetical protein
MPVNVCKFDRQRICREPKLNQDAGSVGGHPPDDGTDGTTLLLNRLNQDAGSVGGHSPDDGTDGTTLLLNRKNRRHLRPFVGDCVSYCRLRLFECEKKNAIN